MSLPPCPKDLQRVAAILFHNGFGFQSPDEGSDKDSFIICKFTKDAPDSDLVSLKDKSGSKTVYLTDWIGYNFLGVHWTEYNLIPKILTEFLNLGYGFATMGKSQAGFTPLKDKEFTFELMEIKSVEQARELIDKYGHPVDFIYPSFLDIWNYKTREGIEFCKHARAKGFLDPPSYESEDNYYKWEPFINFDLSKYEYFSPRAFDEGAEKRTSETKEESPVDKKRIKLGENESEKECMICMDRPADTLVTPCMHNVACSVCSLQLEDTSDAKICCQCRCEISGIYYPDNTIKEIK